MIRINLLPQKKSKRRTQSVQGERSVAIGMGIVMALGGAVFFLVHMPKQQELEDQKAKNSKLKRENRKIENDTKDFEKRMAAFEAAKEQAEAIEELNNARSSPAWFLRELGSILTRNKEPRITPSMRKQLERDENLRWQDNWDPKHVWITSLVEEKGLFTLKGAAQSDGDVTQLAHRMAASMFFDNVQPGGVTKTESKSGFTVYNFTITGSVRY